MMSAGTIAWLIKEGRIPCLFHELTGLYCPGCGGTRAAKALLCGHPVLSLQYHPLVLYCALVAVWFLFSYVCYWKTKKSKYRIYLNNGYIYAGVVITVLNFLYKNYMLAVKGVDLLSLLPKV